MKNTSDAISRKILAAIEGSPDLADRSKQQYARNLEKLVQISKAKDIWSAILAHKHSIAKTIARYPEKFASQHAIVSVVLAAFRYSPELKERHPKVYLAWSVSLINVKRPLDDRVNSAQPTERQALGWVPLAKIIAMRRSMPLGSPGRLLLGMYVDIAPRRNDYANLRIYDAAPPQGTAGNYIVIVRATKDVQMTLTLTEYKTAKTYNAVSEVLPDSLVQDIDASLKQNPRDTLFVSEKNGRPYKSEAVFGNWANATLKSIFGKPLTLTMIRHAFITSLQFDTMTGADRKVIADKMGHSRETQFSYKYVSRPGALLPALD